MSHETDTGASDVNLLWTGGWDSTFQLLRLLLLDRRAVTPFYLIDVKRRSTGMELKTMQRIKDRLLDEQPHVHDLLRPTRYHAVADLAPDSRIADAYGAVRAEKFIGKQYEWLPRFCEQYGVEEIQLCIHRDDRAAGVLERMVVEAEDGFRVDRAAAAPNESLLFGRFTFPVFDVTKVRMAEIADERGWNDLMHMTWFCHTPQGTAPCGSCNPCKYTIEEGLGWRIPLRNRPGRRGTLVARARNKLRRLLE
ncbi:MAG: hypothetical protein GY716_01790 [bacterium]|nr:hypothetical protein [bacterium]